MVLITEKNAFFLDQKVTMKNFYVVYIFWKTGTKKLILYHRSEPILLICVKGACANIALENGKTFTIGLYEVFGSLSFW